VINEWMASNGTTGTDEDGDYSDWIELANIGEDPVSLRDYSISDNPDRPRKWVFPEVSIPPHQYLLIWASGKDRKHDPARLHTGFKLDREGEFIGLYDPSGGGVDSVFFGLQERDVSSGRFPDGTGPFVPMQEATPGTPNVLSVSLSLSLPQGIYAASLELAIVRSIPVGTIHYTRDGGVPDAASDRYESPVFIPRTTVVRARVFEGGIPVSEEVTALYLVGETPGLPVLSLVTSPENLWDAATGIYENWEQSGDRWERPANLALIEDNQTRFQHGIGIRIHGQLSRAKPKKSLRVYFRNEYGRSRLEYPLFGEDGPQEFKRLVIHSTADDASWSTIFSHIRDVLTHTLWAEEGGLISAFRPVVLYLNGAYWGVYWLRERIDRHYIESHFGITDCDFLGHEWTYVDVKEGDRQFWDETLSYFRSRNFKNPDHYQNAVTRYVDRDNFTDYHIFNIFAGNHDWPQKNIDHFRDRNGDPRWRWVMWDHDVCWQYETDKPMLDWATRDGVRPDLRAEDQPGILWSTLILRRLLENGAEYYMHFINRFMDLMNTTLSARHVSGKVDHLSALIRPEMDREMARWGVTDFTRWDRNLDHIKQYAYGRERRQREQLREHFNLQGGVTTVEFLPPEGQGTVLLNTLTIQDFPWSGAYFTRFPMRLTAVPAPGYRFVRWITESATTPLDSADTWFQLYRSARITAVFAPELSISGVTVTDTTAHGFRVVWQTSQDAQARVFYGPDTSCAQHTALHETYRDTHEFILDSLAPNTLYHYRLWNRARSGDTLMSPVYSVRTAPLPPPEPSPPVITSVRIDSAGPAWVSVTWRTDDSTTGCVDYSADSLNWQTRCDTVWNTTHSLRITGLEDTTRYVFHVRCRNRAELTAQTADSVFHTLRIREDPSILGFVIGNITHHSAELSWRTADSTRSRIVCGLDGESFVLREDTPALTHGYHLDGLKDSSLYSLRIESRTQAGYDTANLDTFLVTRRAPSQLTLSGVRIRDVTHRSADITWTTSDSTLGQLVYHCDGEAPRILADTLARRVHSYRLDGLSDTTFYAVGIRSRTRTGSDSAVVDTAFWTRLDREPPAILSIEKESPGMRSMVIRWRTDEASTGLVLYGETDAPDREAASGDGPDTLHSAVLTSLEPDTRYIFRIRCRDARGNLSESPADSFRTAADTTISGIDRVAGPVPERFSVSPNYPNPFNARTEAVVGIPEPGDLHIRILNVSGQSVRALYRGAAAAGFHHVAWEGDNDAGVRVSSGLYLFRIVYTPQSGQAESRIFRMIFQK